MRLALPNKKLEDIQERATKILEEGGCNLKGWQSFIGKLEATRPAISIARIHFCSLQALLPRKLAGTDMNTFIPNSDRAKQDLNWWKESMRHFTSSPLSRGPYSLTIRTDASGLWGGHSDRGATQGAWTWREIDRHINWKELEA